MNDLTCRIYHKKTNTMHECKLAELLEWRHGAFWSNDGGGTKVALKNDKNRESIDIQLYSGKKDKNKQKIYEDDILRIKYEGGDYLAVVQYCSDFMSFILIDTFTMQFKTVSDLVYVKKDHESIQDCLEIVGNIWQNPDMSGKIDNYKLL